jgi:hypothetical protein
MKEKELWRDRKRDRKRKSEGKGDCQRERERERENEGNLAREVSKRALPEHEMDLDANSHGSYTTKKKKGRNSLTIRQKYV